MRKMIEKKVLKNDIDEKKRKKDFKNDEKKRKTKFKNKMRKKEEKKERLHIMGLE